MICLDTNVVIAAISGRQPLIRIRLNEALKSSAVAIPVIVMFELWYGIMNSSRKDKSIAELSVFLSNGFTEWPFETKDAEEAGEIRAELKRKGTPIGPYDVLIAAQARRRGAILITANEREFARVPGLRTEDWSQD